MILQRLTEHYDRIPDATPPGYSEQKVSFCIVLESDGRLNSFESLLRPEGKSLRPRLMNLPGESKPTGSGLNPCFLWDRAEYLLGYSPDPAKRERAGRAFQAFRDRHLALEQSIAHPDLAVVCAFLRSWSPEQTTASEFDLESMVTHFGVFRIAGEIHYVHQVVVLPESRASTGEEARRGTCLISGRQGRIARLHEPKIKGVRDAQTSGALLVSFNASAFTSNGKDQSYNAPVGEASVFKYANALNCLLSKRGMALGDMTVVHWADHTSPLEDAFAELFGGAAVGGAEDSPEEDQERVRQAHVLLTQLRDGTAISSIQNDGVPTRFFILGLSPNASRLSVRLWIEADAGEIQRRLGQHLRDVQLKNGREENPLPLWRMVAATGRWDPKSGRFDTKAVSPQLAGDLARSVLTGAAYPQSLLAVMVRRIRADGEISPVRVAAIKGCLVRNSRLRGFPLEVPVELDVNHSDTAYRCGRLFAILEKAQSDSAGGELNSTIKDRYFSSAGTTPALVFPRLFRLNQHHLGKLETGTKIYYERLMASTMSEPFDFPQLLALAEQGKFIVGYFQQRQDLYTSKKDKSTGDNQ